MSLFFLENKYPQRIENWGDYGFTIWSGFADKDDNGNIFIERTGPFTPEIYLAMDFLICTESMRSSLITAGIEGVRFLPVKKRKVINLDWENFPVKAEIYDVFPDINEPDELLTNLGNDDTLLSSMPVYWSIEPNSAIKIRQIAPYKYKTRHSSVEAYDVSEALGDIVSTRTRSGFFVTDRGLNILETVAGNFLNFVPLKVSS